MERQLCEIQFRDQRDKDRHNLSDKHVLAIKIQRKFQKKLEEANQKNEKTRLENLSLKRKLKDSSSCR